VTPKKSIGVDVWLRFVLELAVLLVGIALAYAGLDKRLAIIENKVEAGIEAQKDFASKAALSVLEKRIERLEQRR
jgi:hypothetical protein